MDIPTERIARHLRPGDRVAFGDGAGAPVSLLGPLSDAAREVGGISLLLCWCLDLPDDFDPKAFVDVRSVMGGYALRSPIRRGDVRYVPARLGTVPALLYGPLRPDHVVMGLRPGRSGLTHGTEVTWLPAAIETGATVLAEVNTALPAAGSGMPEIPRDRVHVINDVHRAPFALAPKTPQDGSPEALVGGHVAALVPEGATIQFGPGRIAQAALAHLEVPVNVWSGVLSDGVVDLDERGLLRDTPLATYVVGSARLYDWVNGRAVLDRVERTHDLQALTARPMVAMNTALEIDRFGQVNVERIGDDPMAGIGGHADFALGASRARDGISVIAVPTVRGGRSTLVDSLSAPTSTPYTDVDVVVTEHGSADLRGLAGDERATALTTLWRDA